MTTVNVKLTSNETIIKEFQVTREEFDLLFSVENPRINSRAGTHDVPQPWEKYNFTEFDMDFRLATDEAVSLIDITSRIEGLLDGLVSFSDILLLKNDKDYLTYEQLRNMGRALRRLDVTKSTRPTYLFDVHTFRGNHYQFSSYTLWRLAQRLIEYGENMSGLSVTDTTEHLNSTDANKEHLEESVRQLKAGETFAAGLFEQS